MKTIPATHPAQRRDPCFLALRVPDFPVAAAARLLDESARSRPCGVLEAASGGGRAREKLPLLAVNRAARLAGIGAGWALGRALVRCPDMTVLDRDGAGETELGQRLVALGQQAAAEVEWTRPDTVIVDLAARPDAAVFRPQTALGGGIEAVWSKAATPDLADLAAGVEQLQGRAVAVAEAEELLIESIVLCGAEAGDLELLKLWGVKTIGDFLSLPKQSLVSRMGVRAKHWQELLRGGSCRVLCYYHELEKFTESFDFEEFPENFETVVLAAKRLVQGIESRLGLKRLFACCLKLSLVLEDGNRMERELRLAEPQSRAEAMLAVLRPYLESLRLPSGLVRLEVEAEATFGMAMQREWFGHRELPQPERWAETVGRLEAMLGSGRVGIPVPADSFRPDGFVMRPALGPEGAAAGGANDFRPEVAVPLRRYRPPLAVAVAAGPCGRWARPLGVLSGPHAGRVRDWRGPFPGSGHWWEDGQGWQRVEWDVEMESRTLLRLAWLPPGEWRVEGVYG